MSLAFTIVGFKLPINKCSHDQKDATNKSTPDWTMINKLLTAWGSVEPVWSWKLDQYAWLSQSKWPFSIPVWFPVPGIPRWSVPWAATHVADLINAALAELQSCSQASSLRPDLAVNEMVVCDVCWQVVKERLLDLLNREEEEESHGENVVKKQPPAKLQIIYLDIRNPLRGLVP